MKKIVLLLCTTAVAAGLGVLDSDSGLLARAQSGRSDIPTFRATSSLVFLDVTVLDRAGKPVTTGLTRDDFTVTEEKKPQRIFSFEVPQAHWPSGRGEPDDSEGNAPVTILVLDLLNSKPEDFAYIRYSVRKFLEKQPRTLDAPAELLVVGNKSLQLLQGYTRSREDLVFALNHLPAELPWKEMRPEFFSERFTQSIDALEQIALQNHGVPGRKNIIWVGAGGPAVNSADLPSGAKAELDSWVHETVNLLVDSRMSLYVIYPGMKTAGEGVPVDAMRMGGAPSGTSGTISLNPFAGDVTFGVFTHETGGNLFYNRNDVDAEIRRSQVLGSQYYTLTYQPQDVEANGKFRHVAVALRDPNLHVVTKDGYFSPDASEVSDPRHRTLLTIAEVVRSSIVYDALKVTVSKMVRHSDSRSVEFTLLLHPKGFAWADLGNGKSSVNLMVAAASLSERREILASKLTVVAATTSTEDSATMARKAVRVNVSIPVPRKTHSVRVVFGTEEGGRMGTLEFNRQTIDSLPDAPTPEPQLKANPPSVRQTTTPES